MISIVVPAYKKQDQIEGALIKLHSALERADFVHEIVVVVDGSPDLTYERACQTKLPCVCVLQYMPNRGKGFALRHGMNRAFGSLVVLADADEDIDATGIIAMLAILEQTQADVVVGSKRHPDSRVSYPAMRRFQSRAFQLLVKILFGLTISDTQVGLKVLTRKAALAALESSSVDGYAYDLEMLITLHDKSFKIIEAPVSLNYEFSSTVRINAGLRVLRDTFGIWLSRRKLAHDARLP